ncbi:MAG: hypothetical protein B7X04_03945 [Parcubacteria group bacterium 21-54-25]|nr:MAG: hypothetical protein B7X04_03945 [Parcubacteria group bacterium 21-54-25]HQU08147.1 hypothetical protein [Candidatus Paceibacterota bacterium]
MTDSRTVVLYHANCPDGFGGAYAAWKKFGESAVYAPVKHGKEPPEGLDGAQVYLIDFCYSQEIMDDLLARAGQLVVLDHHLGVKDVVEAMPEHVFDANRSGATIAWDYFHSGTATPTVLKHLEDDDLFRFALPDTRPIVRYIGTRAFTFAEFAAFVRELEDTGTSAQLLVRLRNYSDYFDMLVAQAVERAKLVRFEGYECYFANTHPSITMRSAVAEKLYRKNPPLALVVSAHPEGLGVSLRSDHTVNVAKIAEKFGGNGHPGSAGFAITWGDPLPWEIIDETL